MYGLGGKRALNHEVRLPEARRYVAVPDFQAFGDVGGGFRCRLEARREHVLVQQGRAGQHRLDDVDDVRQHVVVHLDEVERLFGDERAGGRHCRDRMSFVKGLLPGHDVAHDIAIVDHHLAGGDEFRGLFEEIIAADYGLYPRQPERGGGVDPT